MSANDAMTRLNYQPLFLRGRLKSSLCHGWYNLILTPQFIVLELNTREN